MLHPDGSNVAGFDPGAGADGPVNSITVKNNALFVVGDFSSVNGHMVNGAARLSMTGIDLWSVQSQHPKQQGFSIRRRIRHNPLVYYGNYGISNNYQFICMDTPLNSLMMYTKLLTGLVLLLNLMSLVSISLLVRWLKNPARAMQSNDANPFPTDNVNRKFRGSARAIVMALLFLVISINGLAIYGNMNLRQATEDVVAQMIAE